MLKDIDFSDLRRISVRPLHQGKGIATRLLQWGADLADRDGLYGWLNARPAGLNIYKRAGWEPVEVSEYRIPGIETGPVTSMLRKPRPDRKGCPGVVDQDLKGI